MKKKNWKMDIPFILTIVLAAAAIVFVMFFMDRKEAYTMRLPAMDTVQSISFSRDGEEAAVTDSEAISAIYTTIGVMRTTAQESIQDAPVGGEAVIDINIHCGDGSAVTLFAYEKDGRYYIEQPYNGIFRITEEEFVSLEESLA